MSFHTSSALGGSVDMVAPTAIVSRKNRRGRYKAHLGKATSVVPNPGFNDMQLHNL